PSLYTMSTKTNSPVKKQHGMRFTLVITMIAALAGILSSSTAKAQTIYGDAGQIYVTSNNTVKWYNQDGSGGTTVTVGGPNNPKGLQVVSSTGKLYVANQGPGGNNGFVSKYPDSNVYIGGVPPIWDVAVAGTSIYVTWNTGTVSFPTGIIGQYTNNSFVRQITTGLNDPRGIAVDGSGNVYVANYGSGTIGKYTANLVLVSSSFVTGLSNPEGLAIDASGNIYVSSLSGNTISKYDSSGSLIVGFSITGLDAPSTIALDGTGNLFVSNSGSGVVGKYNTATGATINASFITGISGLTAVTVSTPIAVPEPSSVALLCIGGLAFLAWRNRRTFRAMR
ncbi:MAG: SBBP repeat-containing protein, partial [Chthoniobacterales bacterium]